MIKNLIFDFGDVFLDLDKEAPIRELERVQVKNIPEELLRHNERFETGLLSSEDFVEGWCTHYPQLSSEVFAASWNAMLLRFPQHRLHFLKRLKAEKRFRLILLSNTNDIHIEWVKKHISFFEEFKACFDAFYLSQELGMRKPDPEIFEHVLTQQELKPEETLFIDDTPENTEAAAKLGIHTWNIHPTTEDVTDLFKAKKELF